MGWTAPRRALVLMVGFAIAMEACSGGSGAMTAPSAPAGTETRSSPSSAASTNAPGVARLLFTRTAAGDRTAIFAVNADGTGERQLTTMGAYGSVPRVSPDGDRILVMPGRDPLPTPLNGGSIAIDGSGFVPLSATDPSLNLVPQAWSPDGKRIAFEGWDETKPGRTGVYTARFADGGDLVRVTTPQGAPHDIPLDYSPDGTRLVFYRAVRAEPDFPIDIGGSLWVVNVDDANPHQITTSATAPFDWARWSPDGTRILFGAERLQPKGVVWTVGPDGSRRAEEHTSELQSR